MVSLPNTTLALTKPCPAVTTIDDDRFKPGQVWSFTTRPSEHDATVTILRTEQFRDRTVVHVRLDGLHIRSCDDAAPDLTTVMHTPIDKEALSRSVIALIRTGEVPSYEAGYAQWRGDCGGVYKITLAQIVSVDEATRNQGHSCSLT